MKKLKFILIGFVGLLVFYGIRQEFRALPTIMAVEPLGDGSEWAPTELRVLVRHGYFSPEFKEEAEARLGVAFKISYYFSEDQCWSLLESDESWDLMLVPDRIALRLDHLKRTYDINYERIPNHHNLMVSLPAQSEMGSLLRCSVPLFFTAVGIGYDTRFVGSIPMTWKALFQPANAGFMRGHLGLLNEPRRCLGIALIALGLSPNTTHPGEIKQAAEHVKQFLSLIPAMDRSAESVHGGAEFLAQETARQKIFLTMITSAAISRAMVANPGLRFSSPVDGTLLCIDALVIPRNTQNRIMAEATINFLLQPRISALLTNVSGFATTNEAATAYFDPQLYHGPAFAFPTGKQFYYLQDLGEAEALYQAAWSDLMAYYQDQVVPVIDRELGFDRTFLESNDYKP